MTRRVAIDSSGTQVITVEGLPWSPQTSNSLKSTIEDGEEWFDVKHEYMLENAKKERESLKKRRKHRHKSSRRKKRRTSRAVDMAVEKGRRSLRSIRSSKTSENIDKKVDQLQGADTDDPESVIRLRKKGHMPSVSEADAACSAVEAESWYEKNQ